MTPLSTEAHRDLLQPAEVPWGDLEVPAGWEPIALICERVYEALTDLTESIVDLILQEVPVYRAPGVPRADLEKSVFRNIEMMLAGIAENRGPLPHELEVRAELGRRRAEQGLPADSLLQAYHVGFRELWRALVAAAGSEEHSTRELLLSAVTTVWGWIQEVTDAVADVHHETTRTHEVHSAVLRQRFFDLLVSGETDTEEFADLALVIGFEPEGKFTAVCLTVEADAKERELLRDVFSPLASALVAFRGNDCLVVLQNEDPSRAVAAVRSVAPRAAIGLGLERSGYVGARVSISDAERAAAVARQGETSSFDDNWFEASLLPGVDRLRDILGPGLMTAGKHGELAETVEVFADSEFSLVETGGRLNIHPNTVSYRLDRWETLTGWNPRTFSGLTRSIASIRLHSSSELVVAGSTRSGSKTTPG